MRKVGTNKELKWNGNWVFGTQGTASGQSWVPKMQGTARERKMCPWVGEDATIWNDVTRNFKPQALSDVLSGRNKSRTKTPQTKLDNTQITHCLLDNDETIMAI